MVRPWIGIEAAHTAVSLEHCTIFHHFEKVNFPANAYISCEVKFYTPIICKSVLNPLLL